jgi:hypothetical protein
MKCECGVVLLPPARICYGCGKDYRPSTKKRETQDFRAFRRQVLLSLMSSDTSTTFMATEDYIKTAWDFADRIARAEPKE